MGYFLLPILMTPFSILFLAAVIPPILLLIYVYRQDKIEKEPPGMIAKLFFLGALSVIPAAIIEMIGEGILGSLLDPNSLAYNIFLYFVVVAVTEEGVKHFALRKGSWNSIEFNYRFDAVVYAASVTLGFAAAENLEYVFSYGLSTALVRALTSIPGHCIFGIYMGYYYGMSKYFRDWGRTGLARTYMFLSMLIPILLHGFYDFCATSKNSGMTAIFFIYIIALDIIAFFSVRRFSRNDERV
ncbi:MAG: PrsW family glutamic-type intramembrane protease [Eubacteriales bacterium]|nr:PrsW family glutamic-type intramembrane protease [Eubacteriales bacterium]